MIRASRCQRCTSPRRPLPVQMTLEDLWVWMRRALITIAIAFWKRADVDGIELNAQTLRMLIEFSKCSHAPSHRLKVFPGPHGGNIMIKQVEADTGRGLLHSISALLQSPLLFLLLFLLQPFLFLGLLLFTSPSSPSQVAWFVSCSAFPWCLHLVVWYQHLSLPGSELPLPSQQQPYLSLTPCQASCSSCFFSWHGLTRSLSRNHHCCQNCQRKRKFERSFFALSFAVLFPFPPTLLVILILALKQAFYYAIFFGCFQAFIPDEKKTHAGICWRIWVRPYMVSPHMVVCLFAIDDFLGYALCFLKCPTGWILRSNISLCEPAPGTALRLFGALTHSNQECGTFPVLGTSNPLLEKDGHFVCLFSSCTEWFVG